MSAPHIDQLNAGGGVPLWAWGGAAGLLALLACFFATFFCAAEAPEKASAPLKAKAAET